MREVNLLSARLRFEQAKAEVEVFNDILDEVEQRIEELGQMRASPMSHEEDGPDERITALKRLSRPVLEHEVLLIYQLMLVGVQMRALGILDTAEDAYDLALRSEDDNIKGN